MIEAIKKNDINTVELMLKNGFNPNSVFKPFNLSPLRATILSGNDKITKLLLDYGADPNMKDKYQGDLLQSALNHKKFEIAKMLIMSGINLNNKCTEKQCSALLIATENNYVEIAKLLLEHCADPNIRGYNDNTPLHIAANRNRIEITKLLLEHNANPNVFNYLGLNPLCLALKQSNFEAADLLVKHGTSLIEDKCMKKLFCHIIAKNKIEVVKYLIKHGINLDIKIGVKDGAPLHCATQFNHVDIIKLLLEHGAYVNIRDKRKTTPLHVAVSHSYVEAVELFIKYEANPNLQDINGYTPLFYIKNAKIAQLLLNYNKTDINILDKLRKTALYAIKDVEAAKLLIEHGANVNSHDKINLNPLAQAVCYGSLELIKLYIEQNADTNISDIYGNNLFHLASSYCRDTSILDLLFEKGVDINKQNNIGWTPLHDAVHMNDYEGAKYLLEHGASPHIINDNDYTPLSLALKEYNEKMYNLILKFSMNTKIIN